MGRFAFTHRITGVPPGLWDVTIARQGRGAARERAQRNIVASRPTLTAYGPAVRIWSWPALVAVGAALALGVQAWLLARTGANVAAGLSISIISFIVGVIGARLWYLAVHRQHLRRFLHAGACIQGFLLSALATLAVGGALTGIGAAQLLDATTPGLFLGMALGRPGCFLTGCCAGRPTASRWGLWSSDRVLAVRRVPVQLWEAAVALLIGITTLIVTLTVGLPVPGALFVGAVATYTAARQLLFPFRADAHTPRGRRMTLAVCLAVLAADIAIVAVVSGQ
ncbi:MAG: prolipoprotein diacylglyceryl transferase family protein [Mycobacterium sp.]|nr:prolipoprotein diacylglyceryl transferase family protein [Mycobacterium sp.]